MSRPPFLCLPPYCSATFTAETMKSRTIIETPFGTFRYVRRFFGARNWVPACDLCDLQGCHRCQEFDCLDFDTVEYAVHLELATPKLRLNTPSEARREAAEI